MNKQYGKGPKKIGISKALAKGPAQLQNIRPHDIS